MPHDPVQRKEISHHSAIVMSWVTVLMILQVLEAAHFRANNKTCFRQNVCENLRV